MSTVARPLPVDGYALLAQRPPSGGASVRFLEAFPTAFAALMANKGRSVLTTLGIIIGVAAVIAIVALGQGATASVQGQLQGVGTNVLTITPASSRTGGVAAGAGTSITLKPANAAAIQQSVLGLSGISPVVSGNAQIIAGANNWATRVQSVDQAYQTIADCQIASGSFFTTLDDTSANSVAVLGQTVASNLFPNGQSPLGQLVRIRNMPFTVIGVLASKGTGPGGDQDDTVLIPFQTGQVRLFGSTTINQIVVQVADASQINTVNQDIEQVLRQRHGLIRNQPDDFTRGWRSQMVKPYMNSRAGSMFRKGEDDAGRSLATLARWARAKPRDQEDAGGPAARTRCRGAPQHLPLLRGGVLTARLHEGGQDRGHRG